MNLISILKELWRQRRLVAASALAAATLSVLLVFDVSPLPPSISEQAQLSGEGSIEILVDSARSPIANAQRELTGLTERAGVFARLMAGGNVVDQISRAAGVRATEVEVTGPTPLPVEAPGAGEAPPSPLPYRLTFSQLSELPIVVVTAHGPTAEAAGKLASAAPAALRTVVRSTQERQQTPPQQRVEVRVLGPAQVKSLSEGNGIKVALLAFLVLFAVGLGLILGIPRLVAAWREVDVERQPWREAGGVRDPDVLPLPAASRSEDDESDAERRWNSRER